MILFAALSAQLQHSPYEDPTHDVLESLGLHACLVQLLVALMCNMIGRRDPNTTDSPLGSKSTALLVVVSFGSTLCFFWRAGLWTVRRSQGTKGIMGAAARRCGKLPCCGIANANTNVRQHGSNTNRRSSGRHQNLSHKGTVRGSLRYNAKVAVHLKRGKEESKRYTETREALRLKFVKHKGAAAERLRKRLEARRLG